MSGYILRVMISLDVLVMALLNGKRNETLSAAAWSLEQDGKLAGRIFRPLIDALLWFDPCHCAVAYLNERPFK